MTPEDRERKIDAARKRWPGEVLYACDCAVAPGDPRVEGTTCLRCRTRLVRVGPAAGQA